MIFLKIINYGNCMKKIFSTFSALAIVAALSMFTVSCSSDEIIVSEPQQSNEQAYTIRIPASFNEGSRAVSFDDGNKKSGTLPTCNGVFVEKEEVYVYNVTKDHLLSGNLITSNISEDGKSCVLTGELTGTIEKGDELKLFYNMDDVRYEEDDEVPTESGFRFYSQKGTKAGVLDGAETTVKVGDFVNGYLTTTGDASFQLLQSMFRFQFKDEKNKTFILKSLKLKSRNKALVGVYYPMETGYDNQNDCRDYEISLENATQRFIYAAIRFNENKVKDDMIKFFAYDEDGNLYKGTKNAPKDGFKNGMYYYNKSAINLTKFPLTKPKIEWINVKDEDYMDGTYGHYYYSVYSPNNGKPIEFGISENCNGYGFYVSSNCIIHLKELTAIMFEKNINRLIWTFDDLNLDITGENSIICDKDGDGAIPVLCGKTLKLSGNGTLTVTSYNAEKCGVWGSNNYNTKDKQSINYNNCENTDELDVSTQLAAEGYTVIRSARKDNADGTYTWTYTVKPKE